MTDWRNGERWRFYKVSAGSRGLLVYDKNPGDRLVEVEGHGWGVITKGVGEENRLPNPTETVETGRKRRSGHLTQQVPLGDKCRWS